MNREKSAHTPGPWVIMDNHDTAQECKILVIHEGWERVAGVYREPNAHLIAAAPDMLAVLKETLDAMNVEWGPLFVDANFPKMAKAIAKAEGR